MFPAHPVTKALINAYIESLGDLSAEQMEAACRQVTKLAEQFPKPAHIRAALKRLQDFQRSRPAYLDEPIPPESERWGPEQQEASDKLRKLLGLRTLKRDT